MSSAGCRASMFDREESVLGGEESVVGAGWGGDMCVVKWSKNTEADC